MPTQSCNGHSHTNDGARLVAQWSLSLEQVPIGCGGKFLSFYGKQWGRSGCIPLFASQNDGWTRDIHLKNLFWMQQGLYGSLGDYVIVA